MLKHRILIVEDELIAAMALQDTLLRSGFEVIEIATNGNEALAALQEQAVDLVLMDINLEEKEDGIIIGKKILHEHKLPVVFVTAYADRETIARAREAFPYGYIVKPWQEGELLAVLETALYKHLADKRQQELLDTRNKFFSVIGHDLRSPLAALLLTTRTLNKHLDNLSTAEVREFIEDIHHTVENLYALTDNMLEWAKVQKGAIEVQPEELSLRSMVEEAIKLLQGKASNKGVAITMEVPPQVKVLADKNMLRSVLINLLGNGLKFSYPGGEVSMVSFADAESVRLEVKDKGVGMNEQQLSQLLTFTNIVHTPGTREEKGTGLGLLLSKEFIEANGGALKIESHEQVGTKVSVILPLA